MELSHRVRQPLASAVTTAALGAAVLAGAVASAAGLGTRPGPRPGAVPVPTLGKSAATRHGAAAAFATGTRLRRNPSRAASRPSA